MRKAKSVLRRVDRLRHTVGLVFGASSRSVGNMKFEGLICLAGAGVSERLLSGSFAVRADLSLCDAIASFA